MAESQPIDNPLDALNVQLPGRILALEILLVLLLRQKSGARRLLVAANNILDVIESQLTIAAEASEYQMLVFETARQSLLKIEDEVRRNPGGG